PTVELVGTVSEEAGGLAGACAYRDRLTARRERLDQLVVAEPTGCAPVHGHKGGLGLEIVIAGRAAHSSKPHLGVNAVAAAARVVVAVEAEQERLRAAHGDGDVGRVLGCGTVSTTEIAGGRARNVIPDRCELFVGRRTVDGEDPDEELRRLTGLVRDAAAPATADVRLANGLSSAAFDQPPDSELVATLAELSGRAPTVADYGSNALRYAGIAKEIVVFGPGSIDQAHGDVEWVDIDQLELAADVYRRLLRR
ncbi:MAG TPA: hypothetical protein DEP66_03060, partial [Acidimicrobiaceae bacterium]|nr:hypothetical protein [Acidimicrobiaceae bacterium]